MTRRKFLKLAIGSALTIGAGMALDAHVIEPYSIEITSFPLFQNAHATSPDSPKGAFMSDFHRSGATPAKIIRQASRICMQQKPDIILLGGDYISNYAALAGECADALGELKASRGIYFVLGNHDYWHGAGKVREALLSKGFVDLTNRNTQIGPGLYLCGLDDCWAGSPCVEDAFRGTEKGRKLVFSHNPRIFPAVNTFHCVAICGHTHGGQINIPFIPNPYLYSWKKYLKGWVAEQNSMMYVNRGIGMLTLPFRFRCRPEITLFSVAMGEN
jgi:uncharacterized protein